MFQLNAANSANPYECFPGSMDHQATSQWHRSPRGQLEHLQARPEQGNTAAGITATAVEATEDPTA